ncbi:hypothetical protein I317_02718 [Kwoniella heveanensis CBS 569]|nr:hypothetical protein I317_02718 [Kwoniella heveanensis CBS 569]
MSDDADLKFDEVYNDPDAELTLISSDGVAFRTHKYHLQSCSNVFRGMISDLSAADKDSSTITFTDSQIECASVLRLFLDVIHGNPPPMVHNILPAFRDCVSFCQKYECKPTVHILSHLATQFLLGSEIDPHYIYRIAALLDDVHLATAVIREKGSYFWSSELDLDPPQGWLTDAELKMRENPAEFVSPDRSRIMRVSTWPIWEVRHLPTLYLTALMKLEREESFEESKLPQTAESFKSIMLELKRAHPGAIL